VAQRRSRALGAPARPAATVRVEGQAVRRLRPVPLVASVGILAAAALALVASTMGARAYPAPLLAAADALAAATSPTGQGYRFDVTQRQVVYARPGGSLIPVADPANPQSVLRRVDHEYVNTVLARGSVANAAFWMEMRFGPDETTAPDYDAAPTMFQVIAKNGGLWRNDGQGWFTATVSPGVGMDPATAALLPQLLRSITGVVDQGRETVDGESLRRYAGVVDVTSFPGVVAADGAAFTENPIAVRVWIDASDRLVRLEGKARNLHEQTFDLKVVTTIGLLYQPAGTAPEPLPLLESTAAQGAPAGAR
jgi:hypothetical protein